MWPFGRKKQERSTGAIRIDDPFIRLSGMEFGPVEEITPIRIRKSRVVYYQSVSVKILSELKDKNFQRFYLEEEAKEFEKIKKDFIDVKGMAEEQAIKETQHVIEESTSLIKGKALQRVKKRIPESITSSSIVIIEGMFSTGQNEQLFVSETIEQLDQILNI